MNNAPENEFDLEKLFLPAWAQEPASAKSYAKYQGEEQEPQRRQERHGQRARRREGPPGTRREDNRSRGERRGPPRQEGDRRKPQGGDDTGARGRPQREPWQQPAPLPEIEVTLNPEEKGVESLARQIKMTGRAYPLFGIAQMILQKPERQSVVLSVRKNAEGRALQPLFVCALDDTPWLSDDEAVAHVLKNHFRENHKANIIKPVESCALGGNAARSLRCGGLVRLVRNVWEDQRRFPLQIATSLSQQFAALGLQFFKVNKTITHVCVARPHYLDMEATPVSEGVKRIVEHINAHSRCSRRQ